ncbi:hypothetical protein V5799_012731 [Amblyomma americanum]|uniref:Peptidase M13 N-terminal domain-containing protein n=1 Tax=Amblyomma americanum TaxID=6943 RepID=A0AAQ4E810_AMBAM
MQRVTKTDNSARMELPGALPQSTAGTEAHDGLLAASAAPSSALIESSVEGATDKQLDEAPDVAVPEPTAAGTTDGGQEQVQQVPSEPVPPGEAPGNPPAYHAELQVTAAAAGEFDADAVQTPQPSTFDKQNRILTRTDITLASAGVGTGLLFCCLAIFLLVISKQKAVSRQICRTEDCDRHATLLTNHLNWQLDPCEDYAAFVCSAWEPSKDHRDLAMTAMDDLRFSWYDLFKDTLSRGSLLLPAGKKPLAMYEMCVESFPKNASQISWVRGVLRKYDIRWPETPAGTSTPLEIIVALSYQWQWSLWITVNVLHSSSSGKRRVFVSPGLYLPVLKKHHQAVRQLYTKYWEQFLSSFYPDSDTRPPVNQETVDEIRKMEGDILDTLHGVSTYTRKTPALFSFGEISSHVSNVSATEWILNFQAGLMLQPGLDARDEILVTDLSFLQTVAKIMADYSPVQLKKHIEWLIVQYFSAMADYSLLIRYFGSQEKAQLLLPLYCAHHVEASFKVLVLSLAFYTLFTERDHQTITTGFNSLVSAAVNRINDAQWMDYQSKMLSTEKILFVKNALWPPAGLLRDGALEKLYVDFTEKEPSYAHYWVNTRMAAAAIQRTREYDDAILLLGNQYTDYAAYDYVSNSAKLAMAVANAPAYYSSGTNAMLYGGLLFLMAMQLVKALDREGIRWAANGTAVDGTILSNSTLAAFLAREECHHGAENGSVFPEVPALEVTYSALAESKLSLDGGHSALGENLLEEHVFFMTLCFLTCASGGDRNPSAADCNKAVRNSELFAKAYNCPLGSKMNPEKKCSFFK